VPFVANVVGICGTRRHSCCCYLRHVTDSITSQQYCYVDVLHRVSRFPALDSSQLFDAQDQEDEYDDSVEEETAVIGFWSGFSWLVGMTLVIALLSEYVVATIENASETWGLSVSFISIILLPIVGNAAEHAGAIIFAFKNKLDISLGVALGSATQIGLFVVPLTIIVAWILGINMDLNFNLLETGSLALSIIITAFTLQDGTSHYMKGLVLLLCYIIIAICFFVDKIPQKQPNGVQMGFQPMNNIVNAIGKRVFSS